jgi:acetate---CoA ligase (ADP-forming)
MPEPPRPISRAQVARLLNPASVAVIGVSERPNTAGRNVIANLDSLGFRGSMHVVARNAREIDGRACVASVDELPKGIDCAVLTVPGAAILETVEALAARDVGSIMCFASGFAEMGGEGRSTQRRIAEIARAHDIAFAGPNCLGFTNMPDRIAISFSTGRPPQPETLGRIKVGIVAQSGAMASVLRLSMSAECIGFTYAITTGNEAVLGIEDYLPFLIENDETRVIMLLGETIRRPAEFLAHAEAARKKKKPMVLLHLGQSRKARDSAKSHTGALAGDYEVMAAFARAAGVVLVDTLDELIDTTTVLAHNPAPPAGGVAVITDSGAFKGFTLDYCERIGLPVANIGAKTRATLKAALPEFAVVSNPVDLTAQTMFRIDLYTLSIRALMGDPAVGCVLASIMAASPALGLEKVPYVIDGRIDDTKPLACAFMSGDSPTDPEAKPRLAEAGIPFFRSPERALRALGRAREYGAVLRAKVPRAARIEVPAVHLPASGALTEVAGKEALKAAGIAVPRGGLATSLAEARRIAARIRYPVALKAQAAALGHKSDAGGVVLNIADARSLGRAWKTLHANLKKSRPGLALDGVLVEKMAPKGVEVVVGARRDPEWGPVLMIGLGGVWTEALKDVRFLPADAAPATIAGAFRSLRGAALLTGFRGAKPVDLGALADGAARIGALMRASPGLDEIDVNPLIATDKGCVAVDALFVGKG